MADEAQSLAQDCPAHDPFTMNHSIELTDAPDPSDRDAILRPLLAFNEVLLGPSGARPIAALIRSEENGKVVGGLWGRTSFEWLFVELLFVPENLRGQSFGAELLEMAENEARNRKCRGAWLETLSTDACRFYQRQGYRLFGVIEDKPPGNSHSFLSKRFSA